MTETKINTYARIVGDRYLRGQNGAVAEAIACVLFNTNPMRRPEDATAGDIAEAAQWVSQRASEVWKLAGGRDGPG